MSKTKKYMVCDSCDKANGDHEHVGYGIVFCQVCIDKHLIRTLDGFKFKTESGQKST